MKPPDDHEDTILELIKELNEIEFRRGLLTARLELHMRMRALHVAHRDAAPAVDPDPASAPRSRVQKSVRWGNQKLMEAIVRYLGTNPDRTPRQVSNALASSYESTRQSMMRLREQQVLTRNLGGGYTIQVRAKSDTSDEKEST